MTDFNPTLPLERAATLPASWYFGEEIHRRERERVFGQSWQMVGRGEQVASSGQFFTVDVAGEPILVVRGEDGMLRAFFNVCRHRAAPLTTDECGTLAKLRCRYHGWTYDLAGQLRGTPEFDGVCDFRKEDNGLVPVAVAEWGPFVWVHLGVVREPLPMFLAPLPDWGQKAFDGLKWFARRSYDLNCNWKLYVDNYLDGGYHVNTIHPSLAGVLDYREYATTTHGYTSLQSCPLQPSTGTVGSTRTGDRAAYWWVYPNAMINLYSGVMDTNCVIPLGPERCRVTFDFYFATGTTIDFANASLAVAETVQNEDVKICEDVQRGLGSRSFHSGRFSVRRENAGYYFHQLLAKAVDGMPVL